MELGIVEMEANFVPGSGNQMGTANALWQSLSPLARLTKVLEIISDSQFGFVELGAAWINNLSLGVHFSDVKRELDKRKIKISAICSLMPPNIKTSGPEFNRKSTKEYLAAVFANASALGVDTVVFGSGKSRMVPKGYPYLDALNDIKEFLTIADGIISKNSYRIRIAIEPLNTSECNIINTLGQAYDIAMDVNSPRVGLLLDLYHAQLQDVSFWDELPAVISKVFHIHVSQPEDRGWPGHLRRAGSFNFGKFFDTLMRLSYNEKVSVECNFTNLAEQISPCYKFLSKHVANTNRKYFREVRG